MPYDLNDPNLDFAGQAEILARVLKRGQALRQMPVNEMAGTSGIRAMSGADPGAFLSRAAGVIDQRRAEQGQTALNNEQLRRYDEISRQINAPQEGVDYSNPDALVKENARRMELAGQMSKLPMAQKVSQDYLAKGAAFPETMAQLAYKSIDKGENAGLDRVLKQAMALAALNSAESRNRENNQTKVIIAGMPARSGGGEDDLDRQLKQARIDALKNPEGKALTAAQEKSALQLGNDRTTLEMLRNTFKPEYAGNVTHVLQRKMGELAGGLASQATQDQTRWWADQAMFDELPKRHEQFGATLTPGEKASWAAAAISPNMSPTKIKERLAIRAKIYDDSQKRQRASVEAGGRSTKQFDAAVGATAPAAAAPEPTVVRTGTRNGVKVQQMSDGSIREVK